MAALLDGAAPLSRPAAVLVLEHAAARGRAGGAPLHREDARRHVGRQRADVLLGLIAADERT